MSRVDVYDVVIIGGGCAGLSLARELCRIPTSPKTLVLESRGNYVNDKTWCFWASNNHHLYHLVSKEWAKWEISTVSGDAITHSASGRSYQMIRSIDFYNDALDIIDREPNVNVRTQAPVFGIRRDADGLEISLPDGAVYARRVVDTRPPTQKKLQSATLLQCFMGHEVETERPVFDPHKAGLMTDMRDDGLGFRFVYVLPLSSQRALVETTRFCTTLCPKAQLAKDLEEDTRNLLGGQDGRVIYAECGALPMGMPATEGADKEVYRAGISGGALRAATGYGFQNIQQWAERFAYSLSGYGSETHASASKFQSFMDEIFLRTLKRHPDRSAEFFHSIAATLEGGEFSDFMSGYSRLGVWRRIVQSLPPRPFLNTLLHRQDNIASQRVVVR
ncbi:lycopene cyclase family protein [Halioglobus pacificus]|uniref:Lycopene cyclase n=1 Tax=Parahalioglobus pacificus TaxID=930806 RepID=A0A919CM51_9GAMM|nr:lycopene cyclase family protein [Halioglobus pacificus]GHD36282.1 lycopene cyclase [Halioglobus pacificus]